jgi:hypothetical protein
MQRRRGKHMIRSTIIIAALLAAPLFLPTATAEDFSADPPFTMCFRGPAIPDGSPEKAWETRLVLRLDDNNSAYTLPGMGLSNMQARRVTGAWFSEKTLVPMVGTALTADSVFDGSRVWHMSLVGKGVQPPHQWSMGTWGGPYEDPQHLSTINIEVGVTDIADESYSFGGVSAITVWTWNLRSPTLNPDLEQQVIEGDADDWTPMGAEMWRVGCYTPSHYLGYTPPPAAPSDGWYSTWR